MQTLIKAFDGHQICIAFTPEDAKDASALRTLRAGLLSHADRAHLQAQVNEALVRAGWGNYRTQHRLGTSGECDVFAVGLKPVC